MGDSTTKRKLCIAGGYALILAAAFGLLFYHLDNHLLWGDEAETAVLAQNVLRFGVPKTYDGTNYILLHGPGDETRSHVWIWSPWLQEYVAAGSFLFFGATTSTARLPFAFIGWCSLVALAWVAYRIYHSHRVALASVALMGSSEVFLLHARQCRYYSISIFAEIVLIYGIYQLLRQSRKGVWISAAALIVQFYSNYIVAAADLPALVVLAWLLRKQGKPAVIRLAAVFGIFLAAIIPWLAYAHPWGQAGATGGGNVFKKAWQYLVEFHFHFLPYCSWLLPLLSFLPGYKRRQVIRTETLAAWEQFLLLLLPLYFVVILITPGLYLRYLLPLLPIGCLLVSVWVFRYVDRGALAALLIVIQSTSNCFACVTAYPLRGAHRLRFSLVDYVRGLMTPYSDRFAGVLDFFKMHAHPGERVLSFDPEFPLIFYTSLGIVDGRIRAPANGQLPEWILPATASGVLVAKPVALPDFLKPHYRKIVISVPDSVPGDSIPEPDFYQYQSASNRTSFVIFKLKTGGGQSSR